MIITYHTTALDILKAPGQKALAGGQLFPEFVHGLEAAGALPSVMAGIQEIEDVLIKRCLCVCMEGDPGASLQS